MQVKWRDEDPYGWHAGYCPESGLVLARIQVHSDNLYTVHTPWWTMRFISVERAKEYVHNWFSKRSIAP